MIELKNLKKSYGATDAVRDISLSVPRGELFCFLGPNGAGKTTTIKMMTGLVRPDGGEIHLNGIDAIKDSPQARRILGYIPDMPYLYERLTVAEYLQFVGELYGLSREEVKVGTVEYLEIFGLTSRRAELIKSLSHGTRQRVIYAATLMHQPEVLLVDEPFIGLDPHSIRSIKDLLKERTRKGMTVFMTTHILAIAEEIADRIGIIDQGKIVACGTFEELRSLHAAHGRLEDLFLQLTLPL